MSSSELVINTEVAPDTYQGTHTMKRFLMLAVLVAGIAGAAAAQKPSYKEFEYNSARILEPEQKVYIRPVIAEVQILEGQHRAYFGPYRFPTNGLNSLTFDEIENREKNALYRAMKESDADVIIGALFDCYIDSSNSKELVIELSGFPGKYVNFKNLGETTTADYQMIQVCYPATYDKRAEKEQKTEALR